MSTLSHLNAGARGADRLVRDDRDRFRLLQCVTRALGKRVLAYCIMDTHLHVVAEGRTDELVAALRLALRGYARTFNARHASEGPLLRRPVQPIPVPRGVELARAIHYVHKNPLDTHPPLVESQIAYEWSSARAFFGVSRANHANVARARELMEGQGWVARPTPLTDLEPVSVPTAAVDLVLAAAAQTYGVLAEDVMTSRARSLTAARSVFVALGRLEGYSDSQLAGVAGRTRQWIGKLRARDADMLGVRIARTLLRLDVLRARLKAPKVSREETYAAFRS